MKAQPQYGNVCCDRRRCSTGSSRMPGLKGHKSATALLLNNHCPPKTAIEPQHRTHRSPTPVFWPNSKLLPTPDTAFPGKAGVPRLAADTGCVQTMGDVKGNQAGGTAGEGARESAANSLVFSALCSANY